MTKNWEELEQNVIQWAKDRQIIPNSSPSSQLLKCMSELGELADATLKNNVEGIVDGVGDVLVTLILYCAVHDPAINMTACLESAYETIKERKGKLMPNGIFVKEGDICNT